MAENRAIEQTQGPVLRPLRGAFGVAVLGAAAWCGAVTAAAPASAASKCDVTSVSVTVHNTTDVAFRLDSASHGITNDWCKYPGNPIAAHSVTELEVGDNFFETEVNVAYVAPNHDTVALTAAARYGGGVEGHCRVIPNGKLPSPYRCSAKVHKESPYRGGLGNTHVAKVEWMIQRH